MKKPGYGGRFSFIYLENWKNFQRVEVNLPQRVFLVGPNASGKSNFLDVFRFLRDLASSGRGFREAVRLREGVNSIRCLAARIVPEITVHVKVEFKETIWEYRLRFNQDNQRKPQVREEKVVRDGVVILERPDEEDKKDTQLLTQTHLEQVNMNRPFRELAEFFASVRYLHVVPQLIRDPERSVGRINDPFGGDFLEQIARARQNTRKARLRKIRNALRVAVPQLQEIELWRDDRGTPHLRGKYENWRARGAWQNEKQFSDGTLRLIGLLWAVLDGAGPLLLEEPELSLHPGVIRYIPQLLARLQRLQKISRQVIMSTHSPEILQDEGIGLDEVLLLEPVDEGTTIHPASQSEEIRALLDGGLTLADTVIPKTSPQNVQQLMLFGD